MALKNLFIFIGDSLRYDYFPPNLAKYGTVLKTAAPSLYTPTSIASLVTATSPQCHNVRYFFDVLDPGIDTIFSLFENGSYFDHPEDPMSKIVLRNCPPPEELTNMQEPFVWIERALETHIPYGVIKHGNDVTEVARRDGLIGTEYTKALYQGKLDIFKEYQKGVNLLEEHFLTHVSELEESGFLDDTLIIFTSDHGEVLGEYNRYTHGYPPCKELVLVPTLFWGHEFDKDFLRSIDIIPTALDLLGIDNSNFVSDGLSLRNISKEKYKIVTNEIYNVISKNITKWSYSDGELHLNQYYRYFKDLTLFDNKWLPIPIPLVYVNRLFSKLYNQLNMNYLLL